MRCSPRHMKRRTAEAVLDLVGNGSDVEVLERPGPCLLGRSAVVPVAGPQTAHGSRLLYPCDVCDVDPEHQAAGSPAAAGGALAGGRSVRARGTFGLARAKCERSNSAAKRTMARAARFGIPSRRFQMALLLLVLTSRPFVTGCCAALHLRNWQAGLRFAQASQQAASGPTSRSESIRVAHRHGHDAAPLRLGFAVVVNWLQWHCRRSFDGRLAAPLQCAACGILASFSFAGKGLRVLIIRLQL